MTKSICECFYRRKKIKLLINNVNNAYQTGLILLNYFLLRLRQQWTMDVQVRFAKTQIKKSLIISKW